MSTSTSPAAFTISHSKNASPAAFPYFDLLISTLIRWSRYTDGSICLRQTIPIPCNLYVQKLLNDNFSGLFPYLHHWLPQYIISSYALLTRNILISFKYPLGNLKYINFSKSFPFWFTFDLVNSQSNLFNLFLCF